MKINKKKVGLAILLAGIIVILGRWYYSSLPINKVGMRSDLIMLGDLNNDKSWNTQDSVLLTRILENPFRANRLNLLKVDINRNESVDSEDVALLQHLYRYGDPYQAEQAAVENDQYFPRPRELFKYLPHYEYIQPPLVSLYNPGFTGIVLIFPDSATRHHDSSPYSRQLMQEVHNEAYRFSLAYALREKSLSNAEKENITRQIIECNNLFARDRYYDLLLQLMSMVEDVETLNGHEQPEFVHRLPLFRDHLKELLVSDLFRQFENGSISHEAIFDRIEQHLKTDLNITLTIDSLEAARDFSKLENYIDRAEWQKNKSVNKKEDFLQLLLYAQYDRRYLRAVSRTSRRDHDLELNNHNLPMLLLFREALRIKQGDKKAAIGLLDESIRIPFSWIKSIPREMLPSSIALENFLLPGNKEDGSDKSRHWYVFGGVALYKTPKESMVLSFQREINDVRNNQYTSESVREFIRDMIANTNGIYHIVSVNPVLVYEYETATTP
jgi:hypothetical protein